MIGSEQKRHEKSYLAGTAISQTDWEGQKISEIKLDRWFSVLAQNNTAANLQLTHNKSLKQETLSKD